MKIVIVGDGKVGYALTEQLSKEGHDVYVIDNNPKVLQNSMELLDVMVLEGNGASLKVQLEAGVGESDVLIAATSADETNLLCCIIAKKLGCKNTIARVRNPEYAEQTEFLKKDLGLSMTINPEKRTAREIFRLLQFPDFLKRDSFVRGRLELIELKVKEGSPMIDMQLSDLYQTAKVKVLVCAVEREGQVHIPTGSFMLKMGDKITVAAQTMDLVKLIKNFKIRNHKISNVMIIGGSNIAVYLTELLLKSEVNVKILETDYNRGVVLADLLPNARIIHGDGSMKETLIAEGIKKTDAVVTLKNMDEENIILSMYANYLGVPKSITKVNRLEYGDIFLGKGIDSIVSPKFLTANEILRYVRSINNESENSVLNFYRIANGKAEALEFSIDETSRNLGKPLSKLKLRKGILIVCLSRAGKIVIPSGNDIIKLGDSVVIVTSSERKLQNFNEIFLDDK
ncbi:MAG: Trk system potassium transporter TrkA [Proteocatella sp.]